ncbi:tandem-95 repeat protein [Yoonia sp.]|nr:tandem-95 repeat protein [Yoonia sp.]
MKIHCLESRVVFDGAFPLVLVDEVSAGSGDAFASEAFATEVALCEANVVESVARAGVLNDSGVTLFALSPEQGGHLPLQTDALVSARGHAERLVIDFLNRSDARQQMSTLFNGGKTGEPSAEWNVAYEQMMSSFAQGEDPVRLELRSAAELQGALGAFAARSPDGSPVIYVNAEYVNSATSESIQAVLIEEIGHAIDYQLNASNDTIGDEGQKFAAAVLNIQITSPGFATDNDHVRLEIDDHEIDLETSGTVFDAQSRALVFDSKTNIQGDGTRNEDVVRFNDVIEFGAQTLDAVVTTTTFGASVTTYDGTSAGGDSDFFGPNLSITEPKAIGDVNGVRFRIDFYLADTYTGLNTGTSVTLQNVVVNSYDIDSTGNTSSQRQVQDFKGFASYELSSNTELSTATLGDGSVRFTYTPSASPANNGTYTNDEYRVRVLYDSINSFEVFVGATKSNSGSWSSTAYFALDFSLGPEWDGDITLAGTPAPRLTYSLDTFTESNANDGTIGNSIAITLNNGTFSGSDGQPLDGVIVSNVPEGLTATVTRVDATQATLTLSGSASAHADVNDINNLTVSFGNLSFASGDAGAVTGATKSDLIVDFTDPTNVDDGPSVVSSGDSGSGDEDTVITGTLVVTEPDGLAASPFGVTTQPTKGTATIHDTTGAWTYTPNADYNGSDSFTVTVTDAQGFTSTQLITITVTAVADIVDDTQSVNEDSSVTTNLLANDTFEGTKSITSVTQGTNGTVQVIDASAGTVKYTPTPNFNGTDTYTYTVTSGGVTETATVTVTVNPVNDAPTFVTGNGDADSAARTETDAGLTATGTLTIGDIDLPDRVTAQVLSVIASDSVTGALATGLLPDNAALKAMLGVSPTTLLDGSEATEKLTWTFNSSTEAFDYLSAGETLNLTYTIRVTDGSSATADKTVTITITGTNDAPTVTLVGTDSAAARIEETDAAGRTATGTLTLGDLDYRNTVTTSVQSVAIATGSTTGGIDSALLDNIDDALRNLLSLTDSALTAVEVSHRLSWTFNSGSYAFDYLAAGESLILDYTIWASDSHDPSATVDQVVRITINGTNDTPTITASDDTGTVTEDSTSGDPLRLRDNGTLTFEDLDTTDTSTASVSLTGTPATTGPPIQDALTTALQSAMTLSGNISGSNDGTVTWAFALDNAQVQYLAAGETVTATYRITVTDDAGYAVASGGNEISTITRDVTITITGTNDAPVISLGSGDTNTAALTETDAGLTATGTLTVEDVDTTDAVTATRTLSVGGTSNRSDAAAPTDSELLAMLTVSPVAILDGTQTSTSLSWSFDSGSEAFDYLATGETLVLTYTVTATDDAGTPLSDSETVTITITGTNDAPVVTQQPQKQVHPFNVQYSRDLPAGFADVDTSDRFTYSATGLPDGLSIDAVTGRITGAPSAVGRFSVIITAEDGNGGRISTQPYEFLIAAPPSESSPADRVQSRLLADPPLDARLQVPVTVQSVQGGLSGFGTRSLISGNEAASSTVDRFEPNALPQALKVINFVLEVDQTAGELGLPSIERVISGTLRDGSPLPSWLDFNPDTRSFAGVVPPEVSGQIDVVLIYLDTFGIEQRLNVRIDADSLAVSVSGISDADAPPASGDQSDATSESEPDGEASIDWDLIEEQLFGRGSVMPLPEQGGLRAQMSRII